MVCQNTSANRKLLTFASHFPLRWRNWESKAQAHAIHSDFLRPRTRPPLPCAAKQAPNTSGPAPTSAHREMQPRGPRIRRPRCESRWCCSFAASLELAPLPANLSGRVSADKRFILTSRPSGGRRPGPGDLGPLALLSVRPGSGCSNPGTEPDTANGVDFGVYAPLAQISDRTAFLLESEQASAGSISTPEAAWSRSEPGSTRCRASPTASGSTCMRNRAKRLTVRATTGGGIRLRLVDQPG